MYKCDVCDSVFDKPTTVQDPIGDGCYECYCACPVCGESEKFTEVESCPVCGDWMPKDYHICGSCRKDLLKKFHVFVASLSDAEVDELDEIMDGASIADIDDMME